jgi:hypothetical protein
MVQELYADSLACEQGKKESENGRTEERSCRRGMQVRLHHQRELPLQSVHLQELQLLRSGPKHPRQKSRVPLSKEQA